MNSRRSRHKNEDRLSHLPEEVLSHILSLMPTKFAVRTSALSKNWRYNWTLITNLDFEYITSYVNGLSCFSEFVDRVLKLCKTSQLKLFRFSQYYVVNPHTPKWISEAVRLNVCELDIRVKTTLFPLSLFTCKTLTKLRLDMAMDTGLDICNVPSPVTLPALKTLDIPVQNKPSVIISRFTHGCPGLESLYLEIKWCYDDKQDCNCNIPTLKQLKLVSRRLGSGLFIYRHKFVLNVPNLEYLFVGGNFCPHLVMEDLPSAVEATVSSSDMVDYGVVAELLKGLSGVKSLSWSFSLHHHNFNCSPLPKLANLKHLELKGYQHIWKLVIQILESYSKLKHLCFEEPADSYWIQPQSVPICMLSNLRTVKITSRKVQGPNIQFLKYMLGNAEVLKTLTVICERLHIKEETKLRAWLLRFPRASRFCEIHFVGNRLNCVGP